MELQAGSPVVWTQYGHVCVITIDNPPVNALSQSVRAGVMAALAEANRHPTIRSILIRCEGRTFVSGADMQEFKQPPRMPYLSDVNEAIEACAKPVVVALHGTALGGGFELALASHYRIAERAARMGLPEVKVGLIPGAGGTQRLPRLIGVPEAARWITTGELVGAERALELGVIDEIADGDLMDKAVAAAQRLSGPTVAPRRTGSLRTPAFHESELAAIEQATLAKAPALLAPSVAIDAIRGASNLSLSSGLEHERELFSRLRSSPQAAALQHAFFAERSVAKVDQIVRSTRPRSIERVAVVGAGTMGSGIAMCFANAGIPAQLLETDARALELGMDRIRRDYASAAARGLVSGPEVDRRIALIRPTFSYANLSDSDLILEAVFEDLNVKREVFAAIDRAARPGAILASNTSYLDIAEIGSHTGRPAEVVGMHFFSPAHIMRLLEVVRSNETADDVIATAMSLGKTLGKVAVLVKGSDGFVGNRMLAQRTRETHFLVEEGATPQQVDRVLVEFGFAMGPFAVADLAGLDIGWRNRKARAHLRRAGERDCTLLDKICEAGRLGQKTGAGWYRYTPGSRVGVVDPVIERLILEHSEHAGIRRRAIGDEEILQRCIYSMVNEAARILEEGVVAGPADVDVVWLHGYGFPRWRGGPLYYADQVGLGEVLHAIRNLRDRLGGEYWCPAPLLEDLVSATRGFYTSTNEA